MAVADGFDAATTRRTYQTVPIEPDQVLREMLENPRRGYDTLLVKGLVNLIGIYPVGTCVILDTLEIGVVAGPDPEGQTLNRPLVRLVVDVNGGTTRRPARSSVLPRRTRAVRFAVRSSRSPTPVGTVSPSAITLSESRLSTAWATLRAGRRTALIPYLTAGYPLRMSASTHSGQQTNLRCHRGRRSVQ